jgi:ribosomal protein L7Ae-like RNA K-turn-binding protein
MRKKIHSYLGFAKRSGNLLSGYNTCEQAVLRKKAKLVILTEDVSENTKKKFLKMAKDNHIPAYVYGDSTEVPMYAGSDGKGVFCITDKNFATVIEKEIKSEIDESHDNLDQ